MDFIDQIKSISQQILKLREQIQTEEATKSAFVMPFINALGYNVFNPIEVCPEFTADVPGLKGEKVDYAIIMHEKPIILIECKWCGGNLENPKHNSQLHRYFHTTEAKFSVLTNGIIYRFYTDTEKPNIMDEKSFFEFNMLDFHESNINELKRFSKSSFNSGELEDVARNLLYTKEIKRIMTEQLADPSPEFVKFFASQVYSGRLAASVMERFTDITRRSLKEFINERITERLAAAINTPETSTPSTEGQEVESESSSDEGIVTTEEELEAFHIVKAILREVVDVGRIEYKDTKSYFGVNLDGKTTKTICRLRFFPTKKSIAIIDAEGKEAKKVLSSLNEIYGVAGILKDRARYLAQDETTQPEVVEQ
ncbi:type I restriction endonuclease [Coleofasciculus sp.]|uniref:type I restriction endonuclease n=1 Tax=Coleofasciculus sp. TaxID=3100458 RepID=UPI0039F89CBC